MGADVPVAVGISGFRRPILIFRWRPDKSQKLAGLSLAGEFHQDIKSKPSSQKKKGDIYVCLRKNIIAVGKEMPTQ